LDNTKGLASREWRQEPTKRANRRNTRQVGKRIRVADLEIVSVYDAEGGSEETWQV
jgi:hypothetical protein